MKMKSGFTLVELLLYIVIVALVSGLIAQTLISITLAQQKIEVRKIVDENLDFALKKIESEIKKSQEAAVNESGDILTLVLKDASIVEFFVDESGILQKKVEEVDYPITSDKVIVSASNAYLFSKIEHLGVKPTIRLMIKIRYKSDDPKLSSVEIKAQTTVSLR